MEINKNAAKVMNFIKKYRYVILVLLCGLVLMLIPDFSGSETETNIVENTILPEVRSLGSELEEILSYVDGAGTVKVLVTTAQGEEILYQTDSELYTSDKEQSQKSNTVLITGSDKVQSGLISRVDPPRYLGVIVLCQGAGSSAVRLAIVDAVAKATGLGADSISVLKMK